MVVDTVRRAGTERISLELSRPVPGVQHAGHVLRLAGRVEPESGVRALRLVEGVTSRAVALDGSGGFDTVLAAVGWPTAFSLDLVATDDAGEQTLATLVGRRTPLTEPPDTAAPAPPAPEPVLVTSIGRTGTSWLMHLLGEHPLVSVDPAWPHETSATRYWTSTLLRVAESPHGLDAPGQPAFPATGSWWQSGHAHGLPGMADWLAGGSVEVLAAAARAGIRGTHLAVSAAGGRAAPRWLAEKALPGTATRAVRELFPDSRELVLVRDFRDMLASMEAFDARRGYAGFGRDAHPSEAAYDARMGALASALHGVVRERPDALVVRYEGLVADPVEEVGRVLRHLDLPPDDAADVVARAARRSRDMDDHATSDDAVASVGRWRRDLAPHLRELAERELGRALSAFGYL